MKNIVKDVFRAYDIRGVVDADFDPEWVERLGRACGAFFLKRGWRKAVVGHDCRLSSPEYQRRIVAGLNACGVEAVYLDQVPTPVFYFAARKLGLKAGVMVTASHNPAEYNGFKVWGGDSTVHSGDVEEIYEIMAAGEFPEGSADASFYDVVPIYLDELAFGARMGERKLKVVVDGGNGTGGEITSELLRRVGVDVVSQYCEPDGRFPNHHPDPVVEKYMRDLLARVPAEKADLGVGLDGDNDRLGAVDETGRLMYGDQLLAIFARDMLKDFPKAAVLGEVKCSHLMYEDILAHGGEAVMYKAGHSLIKAKMKETGAKLGGEMSGHFFFADRYYGFDDATYAALRLCEILSHAEAPLSSLLSSWPKTYNTPEIRLDCSESIKFEVVRKAQEYFMKNYKATDIDGVRLSFPDGWALVRASNTQPVLVLRFEAESAERLEEIRALVMEPLGRWIEELS